MNETNWVCFAMVRSFQSGLIILVQDKDKPLPHFWKMPGGRKDKGETYPVQTMNRELEEELLRAGVVIKKSVPIIEQLHEKPRPHKFMVFEATCYQKPEPGEEILQIGEFSEKEILELIAKGAVLPNHGEALKEILA